MIAHGELAALAIICITVLESVALATGHDGYLLVMCVGAISSVAGYHVGRTREHKLHYPRPP